MTEDEFDSLLNEIENDIFKMLEKYKEVNVNIPLHAMSIQVAKLAYVSGVDMQEALIAMAETFAYVYGYAIEKEVQSNLKPKGKPS